MYMAFVSLNRLVMFFFVCLFVCLFLLFFFVVVVFFVGGQIQLLKQVFI